MGQSAHDTSGYHAIDRNISVAREAAAWVVNHGLYFFCPHLNSAHFEVIAPDVKPDFWYALDFRILRFCDALLVVGDWQKSKGTIAEIAYCRQWNIPVYFFDNEDDRKVLLSNGDN